MLPTKRKGDIFIGAYHGGVGVGVGMKLSSLRYRMNQ